MDGGVADTTRGNIVVTHQAVPRQSVGEEKAPYKVRVHMRSTRQAASAVLRPRNA